MSIDLPGHSRSITIHTSRHDDELTDISAVLLDKQHRFAPEGEIVHHMRVTLRLKRDLTITDCRFETLKAPYLECSQFVAPAQKLIGKSAGKGFTKTIYDLYGSVHGCSHILTLLTNLAPAIRQGMAFTQSFPETERQLNSQNLLPKIQEMAKQLEDSCMVWAKDSAVQKDIANGNPRDLAERIYPGYKAPTRS